MMIQQPNKCIKFRAWSIKDKIMFNVDTISFINSGTIIADGCFYNGWCQVNDGFDIKKEFELMQYTGLIDKNEKEIYEGDIVKGHYYEKGKANRFIGTVSFYYGCFKIQGINQYYGNQELDGSYEIIGNIYENENFLKQNEVEEEEELEL